MPKTEERPYSLVPDADFTGRVEEIKQLNFRVKQDSISFIVGPSNVGKSALFREYLDKVLFERAKDKSFSYPLSLLYLLPNEKSGNEPLLRSLEDALESICESKAKYLDDLLVEMIDEDDENEAGLSNYERILSELCSIIHEKSLIVVIENCHLLKNRRGEIKRLEEFLSEHFFRFGSAILISRDKDLIHKPEKRITLKPLELDGLKKSESILLLENIGIDKNTVREAISILGGLKEAFYPIVLKTGALNFLVPDFSYDKSKSSGENLAECIFNGAELRIDIENILNQLQCNNLICKDGNPGPLAFLLAFALLCNSKITNEFLKKLELQPLVRYAIEQLGSLLSKTILN